MKYIYALLRRIYYIKFKIMYPRVPVINPSKVGKYYSQDGQDLYIASLLFPYLKDGGGSNIVDVGANHPERFSNSYFFERFFNCNVIAIDPIQEYSNLWAKCRPKAKFIVSAVGSSSCSVELNMPVKNDIYDDMFSSVGEKNPKIGEIGSVTRVVPCNTLDKFLLESGVSEILFVSIDVEGYELDVLQGIDFNNHYIKCFVIENNTNNYYGSEDIRVFMKSKGFVFYSRIGCLDDVYINALILDQLN